MSEVKEFVRPDGTTQRVHIKNNVTRDTFDWIRDNPGSKSIDVCKAMLVKGHKRSSVYSIISQFVKNGVVARHDDTSLAAMADEYIPTGEGRNAADVVRKFLGEAPPKAAKPTKPGKAARHPASGKKVSASVWALIDTLTIAQARELRAALNKLFSE